MAACGCAARSPDEAPSSAPSTLAEPESNGVTLTVRIGTDTSADGIAVAPIHDTDARSSAGAVEGHATLDVAGPGAYALLLTSSRITDGDGDPSVVGRAYLTVDRPGPIELVVEDKAVAPGHHDWGTVWPYMEAMLWIAEQSDATFEALDGAGSEADARRSAVAGIAARARAEVEATPAGPMRTMMTVHWLNFFGQWLDARGLSLSADAADWALAAVPLDEKVWAVAHHELMRVFYVLGEARAGAEVERLIEDSPYAGVRIAALFAKLDWGRDRLADAEKLALLHQIDAISTTATTARLAHAWFDPHRAWAKGQPLPEFDYEVFNPGEGAARLSSRDLVGRPSVIMFWAEDCGPCVAKMEEIHRAYAACNGGETSDLKTLVPVDDPRVNFVSIGWHTTQDGVRSFRANEWPMPWTHVVLDEAQNERIMKDWYIMSVPTYAVVDADGTVVADDDAFQPASGDFTAVLQAHGLCTR